MTGKKRGFTLIESLSVIAIIGILATLSVYVITQAQRQARDAKRKSDIAAIAQGFEARFLDKTCSNQAAVGLYPGRDFVTSGERMIWRKVSELNSASTDPCNPFPFYLSSVPSDPHPTTNDYWFNLSAGTGLEARHYRLAARLEREPSEGQWEEICRLSDVWYNNFLGERYDGCPGDTIVRLGKSLLAATLQGVPVPQEVCGNGVDDDGDGEIDEGCGTPPPPPPPTQEICGNGIDDDGDGQIDEGCGIGTTEVCGNGVDDDGDGEIDEGCGAGEEEEEPLPYNYYFGR